MYIFIDTKLGYLYKPPYSIFYKYRMYDVMMMNNEYTSSSAMIVDSVPKSLVYVVG